MSVPFLVKPIPSQVINERASYGPFDLKEFIQSPDGKPLHFTAQLRSGEALPKGLICTEDGQLIGIPAKETSGNYQVLLRAESEGGSFETEFIITIKPSLADEDETNYFDKLKSQVWEALQHNIPAPDFGEMMERAITPLEVNYLLERWAVLIIWDAFNLDPALPKEPLQLKDASEKYEVYDRGNCLVASPVDLFDHNRTILDGLKTAEAMAREVYKRGWTIEMAGYQKLTQAAWIELQHLGDQYGKRLEILNFYPTARMVELYTTQAIESPRTQPE